MGWPDFFKSSEKPEHAGHNPADIALRASERLLHEAHGKPGHPLPAPRNSGIAPVVAEEDINLAGPVNAKAIFRTANHILFDSGGVKQLHRVSGNSLSLASTISRIESNTGGFQHSEMVAGQVLKSQPAVTVEAYPGQSTQVTEQLPGTCEAPITSIWSSPAGRIVSGAMGVFGLVGGGWQLKHACDMYSTGRKSEGSLAAVAGLANMTAGGSAFFATSGLAQTIGLRAAAVGAVIDGGMLMQRGYLNGDGAMITDGVVRFGSGGTMLAGGTVGMCGAAAYGGWAVGRLAGENVRWGGKTLDQHTMQGLDSVINLSANLQLNSIELHNRDLLASQADVIGASLEQLKASGKSIRDVSEAIIGLREEIEHETDSTKSRASQQEVKRLIAIRGMLSA